jgi:hypothetical protein
MDAPEPSHTRMPISPRAMVVWFFIVLALYLAAFYGFEYFNHRKGPWEVEFLLDASGHPKMVVSQGVLKISNVVMAFYGEKSSATNLPQQILFDQPRRPVPFGQVIYEDLRALPGVVTFDLFGHEIELLPRVLIVNKKEIPWHSGATIDLSATNKPALPPKPPKGY